MARKVIYNLVTEDTNELVAGILLTNKELEIVNKGKLFKQKLKICKVKVYNTDVYWSFGYRFANVYQEVIN